MTKVTLKKLNAYLQVRAPRLELVKGKGYFYFADRNIEMDAFDLPDSVYVYALNHLSLERWYEVIDAALTTRKN